MYDRSLFLQIELINPTKSVTIFPYSSVELFHKDCVIIIFSLYINDKVYCSLYHEIWQILSVSKHLRAFGVPIWAHKSLQ